MTEHVLEREQLVPRPLDEVSAFFAQARDLDRIFDYRCTAVRRLLDER